MSPLRALRFVAEAVGASAVLTLAGYGLNQLVHGPECTVIAPDSETITVLSPEARAKRRQARRDSAPAIPRKHQSQ